jgi:predicted DNA-binding antitoxin AbrB/MazE fold protein
MTKQIEAVYENGVLRPVEPVELTEGEHFHVIIVTRNANHRGATARPRHCLKSPRFR